MQKRFRARFCRCFSIFLICFTFFFSGCATRHAPETSLIQPPDELLLEITCEKNLSYLGAMIEDRLAERKNFSFCLMEAQEIFQLAQTLYLQKEYSLAIELIENAIEILEESGE